MRALIVGAGRDELAAAEAGTRRVRLAGLTEPEVAALAGTAMTDALWERTGGNPLFVSEVLRLLQADPTATLPASVRDVIGRRVARLSQECRRVLSVAAVLGREFGVRPLAAATEIAPESLLDLLDEALQARGIAEADSAGRMRFAHVLIRDSLYEMLTPAQRAREHRRALTALERHYGDARGARSWRITRWRAERASRP